MVKDMRITYRRRCSYRTKANRVRVVKTPGGKLVAHYVKKSSKGPACGDCKKTLQGLPRIRPKQFRSIAKHDRTVSRAYGGSRCATCVRDRIMRAFIIEEQKIVKQVLQEKLRAKKE